MSHFEGESKLNINVVPSAKDMSVRSVWRPHLDNILLTWTAARGRSSTESTNSWTVQENVSSEFALKNSCIDAWFVSLLTSKETNSCEFPFNEETKYSPKIHRHYTRVMNWFACVNYISLQKQEVSETTGVSLLFSLYQSSCFQIFPGLRAFVWFSCLAFVFHFLVLHSTQSVKSTNRTET